VRDDTKFALWGAACGFLGMCGTLIVIADMFLLCSTSTTVGMAIASIGLLTGAGAVLLAGAMWDSMPWRVQ
jgi:hypothetical protein